MKITKQIIGTTSANSDEYSVKESVTKINHDSKPIEMISVTRIKHSIMNLADKRKYSAEV